MQQTWRDTRCLEQDESKRLMLSYEYLGRALCRKRACVVEVEIGGVVGEKLHEPKLHAIPGRRHMYVPSNDTYTLEG